MATGACQRYRDCVCALADRAQLAKGTRLGTLADALAKNCTEAETLLRTAADDPASCNTGRTLTTGLVRELSASLPKACE